MQATGHQLKKLENQVIIRKFKRLVEKVGEFEWVLSLMATNGAIIGQIYLLSKN